MNDSTMEVVLVAYFLPLIIFSFKVHDSQRLALPLLQLQLNITATTLLYFFMVVLLLVKYFIVVKT
jgi:hypothetical protein